MNLTKKVFAIVISVALIFGIFTGLPMRTANAEAVEYLPFSVVFTGGMHGNIKPFDFKGQPNYGGFAKASTKINEIRKQLENDKTWDLTGNTMVLDIGNFLMGSQTGWLFASKNIPQVKEHPTITAMNSIGYDAAAYGAGEFSMAPSIRERLKVQSKFPWLTANVVVGKDRSKLSDEFLMKVYKIPTAAHPLRFGVVGLTNPAVFSWEDPTNLTLGNSKLDLEDYIEKAREHAESLKETGDKMDFIIISTDLGLEKNADGTWKENLLYQMIQEVTHVDFVCSSSPGVSIQQEIFVVKMPGGKTHETLVCQLPEDGVTMGRMDFVFEKCTCPVKPYVFRKVNSRRDMKSRFITLGPDIPADPTVLDGFKAADIIMKNEFDRRIGETTCELNSALARRIDNPIAEIACNVMMQETGAQFAITDIWTTSANIPKGSFTFGDMFNLFPKDSKIYKLTMTGAQLKNALTHAASIFHTDADTNFIVAKGFNYYLDIKPDAKSAVGYMNIGTTPIDLKKTYTVATNSYVALGQGGYDFKDVKREPTRKKLLDAILGFIRNNQDKLVCRTSVNWFVVPDYIDHYSAEYVDVLMGKKIIGGDKYGRYLPDNFMTKAEASKMLLSIYDLPQYKAPKATYKDVSVTHWAFPFVEGGVKIGQWFWLTGMFGVNTNVTREEVMTNMVITIGQKAKADAITPTEISEFEKNFADANDCSSWAKKYVAYATRIGLVGGRVKDGKNYVDPKSNIRRGDVAIIMSRARFPVVAVMGTSDVRSEVEQTRIDPLNDRKVGGWEGLAYNIGNLRATYDKNLLIDAGGMYSGTAWAELAGGKMATGLMNTLKYDFGGLGIRDMYLGFNTIKSLIKDTQCPILASNVDGLDGVKKSDLKDISGIKVGVVGALDSETLNYICDAEIGSVKTAPMAAAINAEVKALKSKGAEIIIANVSSSGYIELGKSAKEGFKGPAAQLATSLSGVNVIFVSGSPLPFVAPTSSGLWVIAPGIGGSTLGLAKVRFDAKNRTIDNINASLLPTYNDVKVKPSTVALADSLKSFVSTQTTAMKNEVERQIGRTSTGLNFDDSNESLLGDFIASYAADQLGVDLIVHPSDHTRTGIAPGTITVKDIYNVLPIEDTWIKAKITGQKLKDICESSISGERGVLQIWGFSFVFTRSRDPGLRVSEWNIVKNCQKSQVQFDKEYTIAMPAREFYALPGFAHEALHDKTTGAQSACIYIRKTIIEQIKKLTEVGQAVDLKSLIDNCGFCAFCEP